MLNELNGLNGSRRQKHFVPHFVGNSPVFEQVEDKVGDKVVLRKRAYRFNESQDSSSG
jgi:hypothetical protein